MGATVHQLPTAGGPQLISKQQLAAHLGRSPRWIEMRVAAGMPSENLDRYGRRMFNLQAVEAWLRAGEPVPANTTERLARLEAEVAQLRAEIQQLRSVS